jgi:hypothetical protein
VCQYVGGSLGCRHDAIDELGVRSRVGSVAVPSRMTLSRSRRQVHPHELLVTSFCPPDRAVTRALPIMMIIPDWNRLFSLFVAYEAST